jgi:hypothetical protein
MRLHLASWAAAALAGLVALAAPALAQQTREVRGTVYISGKTPVDPPPDEAKNTHAYLQLSGAAALAMYRGMRAKEEKNACEPGKKLKRAGSLACSLNADGRGAVCDFSIDLVKGTLDDGRPC